MRLIASSLLMLSGLVTLALTYDLIFPNSDGLLDLSGLEWIFLLLYAMAIQRLHSRNHQLGHGIWRTGQKVVNSAGVLGLVNLAVSGALLVFVDASASSARTDELSADTWAQGIWLGAVVVFAYFAAPTVQSPPLVIDSGPIDMKSESAEQKQIEINK